MRWMAAAFLVLGACAGSPYAINKRDNECRAVLSNPQANPAAVDDCNRWFGYQRQADHDRLWAAGPATHAVMQGQANGQAARAAVLAQPSPQQQRSAEMRCRPSPGGLPGELTCEQQ